MQTLTGFETLSGLVIQPHILEQSAKTQEPPIHMESVVLITRS